VRIHVAVWNDTIKEKEKKKEKKDRETERKLRGKKMTFAHTNGKMRGVGVQIDLGLMFVMKLQIAMKRRKQRANKKTRVGY